MIHQHGHHLDSLHCLLSNLESGYEDSHFIASEMSQRYAGKVERARGMHLLKAATILGHSSPTPMMFLAYILNEY